MIIAVTAFVPIPGHPRAEAEYHRLAKPLQDLAGEAPLLLRIAKLEECWLHKMITSAYEHPSDVTHSVSDNPKKNSLAYHVVQAQKTEFLVQAAEACGMQPDVYVWIDYGIFHVPGVTAKIIKEFLARADGERTITIPGCWGPDYVYDDEHPCWRFCGGVMVVPREHLIAFDEAMKKAYARQLYHHDHVSWEVNALARVERNEPDLPIWWYQADHDASMFTNYRATKHADGRDHMLHRFEARF